MSKNEEKKKKSKLLPVIVVLLLIIAVLMIVASLGFGGELGSGNGDGNNNNSSGVSENQSSESTENSNSETVTETVPEETTESINYIDVSVSGDVYLVNGNEKTLDAFITLAKESENTVVRITDENAVADAVDGLVSELENNNIQYIEPTE